jgi:hypothetical protein
MRLRANLTAAVCAFAALTSLAGATATPRDAIRLVGKSESDVIKALGRPASERKEEQFHEGTWKLSGTTVKFLFWKGGKFGNLSVFAGPEWKSALKKVGLSSAGVKPRLTSWLGIEGYKKKKTFVLVGVKGLPSGMSCIWNGFGPDLEFGPSEP